MNQSEIKLDFINERFGELFRNAVQSYNMPQKDLCTLVGEAVGRTQKALDMDFGLYNIGNMLGEKVRLTVRRRPNALETYIGRLLDVMYAMSIPEEPESEMLSIIRDETKLDFEYPRTIPGESLTRPYDQSE